MHAHHARLRYAADAVTTASPARLLCMLYDRLVRDLQQGERAQRTGDRPGAHAALVHAQDILLELRTSLRTDLWDGAAGLASLYAYLHSELVAANVALDADRTAACLALVEPLRAAWHEAAASTAAVSAAPAAVAVAV